MGKALEEIARDIVACTRCPRLRAHCEAVAIKKKREFRDWNYWGKPVPGFGDPRARLWIIGLAPAAHGANRTGRMFTGDSSGNWLYAALHRHGFANQAEAVSRDDGLVLRDAFISGTARCAPPDNRPLPEEIAACAPYLDREMKALSNVELVLALGSIAYATVLRLLARHGIALPEKVPPFSHGGHFRAGRLTVLASYHPSRQNTQTGRLTPAMWDSIFRNARRRLGRV